MKRKLHVIIIKTANDSKEPVFSTFSIKAFNERKSELAKTYAKNQFQCKHLTLEEDVEETSYKATIKYSVTRSKKISIREISIGVDIASMFNNKDNSIQIRNNYKHRKLYVYFKSNDSNQAFNKLIDLLNTSLIQVISKQLNLVCYENRCNSI